MTRAPAAARQPVAMLAGLLALLAAGRSTASEGLTGRACRSVHLGYAAPEAAAVCNEIAVQESHPGTYFCVLGFHMGYFGIQELSGGRKVVIFSVWDPGSQNDPASVPEERRVKVPFQGEGVEVRRFGGEGTGGQSFFPYDWKTGTTYRFCVRAKANGEHSAFSAHFFVPEQKAWKHLATFETSAEKALIREPYSFVEDFLRNRVSTGWSRRALFGPVWIEAAEGSLREIRRAAFTADGNRARNIDAGVEEGRFYLATGGATTNTGARLWSPVVLPGAAESAAPRLPP